MSVRPALLKESQLQEKEITDNDRYVLNHKNETLKEIRI